ncbi:MAG: hypothetical protein JSV32_07105 [Dehalococcoidia bacterium]|nr:MAG: hypothetical protein JSV32_07105 [Dehalococcoidia bacterium]
MFKVGDKDESGYVCRYIKGPLGIWEAPDGDYGIYLTVKDKDFMGTLYNHRRSYDEALLIADTTYDKLTKRARVQ